MKSMIGIFLLFSSIVSIGYGKKESIDEYKKTCRPGTAIGSINNWNDQGQFKLSYSITCVNVSASCEEDCSWRDDCLIPGAYVRGVHPMYDKKCKCHRSGYLCCVPKPAPKTAPKCDGKFNDVVAAKRKAKNSYIGGAKTVNNKIAVSMCTLPKPTEKLCPMKDTVTHEKVEYTKGKGGLAGLMGLIGPLIPILLVAGAAFGGGFIFGTLLAKKQKRSVMYECIPPMKSWCCGSLNSTVCESECSKFGPKAGYIESYSKCMDSPNPGASKDACCY